MERVKTGDILNQFRANGPKNDFERLALFCDDTMKSLIEKLEESIAKFKETGDYAEYLLVKGSFEDITRLMIGRDVFITHNSDRGLRKY
jgi:hypothetical protein